MIFIPFSIDVRGIVMSMTDVCLSAHTTRKSHGRILPIIFYLKGAIWPKLC